jgi:hypothetical protein
MGSVWRSMEISADLGFRRISASIVAIQRHLTRSAAVAVWATLAVGCASLPGSLSPDSPADVKQAAVAERANARWQAIIKGEYGKAYEFSSEASRQAVTLDRFRDRARTVAFRDAVVKGVECAADTCRVDVLITYDHRRVKGVGFPLTETWIIERGNSWYIDPIK